MVPPGRRWALGERCGCRSPQAENGTVVHNYVRLLGEGFTASRMASNQTQVSCMRLWSLHPKYLDPQGLVALWREALLARAVLRGDTRGYTRHPQLERFREHPEPEQAINAYLAVVHDDACRRGYCFDQS